MRRVTFAVLILNVILLLVFWTLIQLDVKFSFGAEQSKYVFNKGQELSFKTNVFIVSSLVLNFILSVFVFLNFKQNKKEEDISE